MIINIIHIDKHSLKLDYQHKNNEYTHEIAIDKIMFVHTLPTLVFLNHFIKYPNQNRDQIIDKSYFIY